MMWQA